MFFQKQIAQQAVASAQMWTYASWQSNYVLTHKLISRFSFFSPGKVLFCLQLIALFSLCLLLLSKKIKLTKMIPADSRNRRKIVVWGDSVTFNLDISDYHLQCYFPFYPKYPICCICVEHRNRLSQNYFPPVSSKFAFLQVAIYLALI